MEPKNLALLPISLSELATSSINARDPIPPALSPPKTIVSAESKKPYLFCRSSRTPCTMKRPWKSSPESSGSCLDPKYRSPEQYPILTKMAS